MARRKPKPRSPPHPSSTTVVATGRPWLGPGLLVAGLAAALALFSPQLLLLARRPPESITKAEVHLMPASAATRGAFGVADATRLPNVLPYAAPRTERAQWVPMGATFRNLHSFPVLLAWDDGSRLGRPHSEVAPGASAWTGAYEGHAYHVRRASDGAHLETVRLTADEPLVVLGPGEADDAARRSAAYAEAMAEVAFRAAYREEHGVPWLSFYPRRPPRLPLWPADFVGQTHRVRSFAGHAVSASERLPHADLELQVLSLSPRVLLVRGLLSEFELAHVEALGASELRRSAVSHGGADGRRTDEQRTSDNAWVSRASSALLDGALYQRFADVLNVTAASLREGPGGCVERLQVVRYRPGQSFEPHHDFGNLGRASQRFSTLFVYLRAAEEGGGTAFPKALPVPFEVRPPPGSALLFYSMLPDGNGDDRSWHAGTVVRKGEKMAANLWSWDPEIP